jgi:hypothetical protein
VIAVSDAHFGESFEFEVEGESALDASRHPYAYAAARHCHATEDGSMSPNCSKKAHARATEPWLPISLVEAQFVVSGSPRDRASISV